MINGLISVLVVFVILAVGYYFTVREKWPDNTNQVFSIVVVQIAAPTLAVVSIENRFTPDMLRAAVWNLLIIVGSILLMYAVGRVVSKILKLPLRQKGCVHNDIHLQQHYVHRSAYKPDCVRT